MENETTVQLIGGRELGRLLGVSEATIRKARESGRIQSYDAINKKYIMPAAADEFDSMRDPSKVRDIPELLSGGEEEDSGNYKGYKERHEKAKAKLAELELKRREGQLVSVESIERQAKKVASIAKRLLMAVPDRISQDLAADCDQNSIKLKLANEIRKVLEAMSDEASRIR